MSVKEALEVVGFIMARHFYTIFEKETLEVVGSILERLCRIGKYVARYVLKTPCGVILPLTSQLILTVARPLDFRLGFSCAVLSAVIS